LFAAATAELQRLRGVLDQHISSLDKLVSARDGLTQKLQAFVQLGSPAEQIAHREKKIARHQEQMSSIEQSMASLLDQQKELASRESSALTSLSTQRSQQLSALLAQLRSKEEENNKKKLEELQALQAVNTKRKEEIAREALAKQKELEASLNGALETKSSDSTLTNPPASLEDIIFDRRNNMYELVAVVQHLGSESGGHYIVYRKLYSHLNFSTPQQYQQYLSSKFHSSSKDTESYRPKPSQWVRVSDTEVHPVLESQVKRAEAYMLYYQKINGAS